MSSVNTLSVVTGKDNKEYKMLCIPHKYIFGWLFTINPENVKDEAREAVLKYRIECYDALFNHFSEKSLFLEEKQQIVENALREYDIANETFNISKKERDEAKKNIEHARNLDFNEWKDARNIQLTIDFEN